MLDCLRQGNISSKGALVNLYRLWLQRYKAPAVQQPALLNDKARSTLQIHSKIAIHVSASLGLRPGPWR